MGCDGIWDVMTNQDAINFINEKIYIEKIDLKTNNLARELANHCIKNKKSTDNVSIVIIYFVDNL